MLSREIIKTCYVHFSGFQASTKYNAQCLEQGLGTIAKDLENHSLLQYKPSAPCWARRKDSQFLSSKKQTVVLPSLLGGQGEKSIYTFKLFNRESIKQAGESRCSGWPDLPSQCRVHIVPLTLVEICESVPREDNIDHGPLESFLSLLQEQPSFHPSRFVGPAFHINSDLWQWFYACQVLYSVWRCQALF